MKPPLLCLLFATGFAIAQAPPGPAAQGPLSPAASALTFTTPDDLLWEQVLAEPVVRQPVFLNFDEKGRMWVVQYLQYPQPAGLKMLSKDGYWRASYDGVPAPPPNHVRGDDRITIHADARKDGSFSQCKTFVDGLNIATAVARGRGGVWVLNPPYLLFYPDRNDDDVPDGGPEVHLSGFGLEDTHSVVNSLCWGPDGWLYAAQGSTVTAKVRVTGRSPNEVTASQGQHVWRYRPPSKDPARPAATAGVFEIFAEGGGNAFGLEFDAVGRVYSGHNGGDTRGFQYVQGGYFLKGFAKHGPLSNPYAFGYFPAMKHNKVPRFTHTYVIYEGDNLPDRYQGMLFGVAPLLHHVVMSEVKPEGSTRQTRDVGHAVTTTDGWFTPVDVKLGPDGALYVADWYDGQCSHVRNQEGQIDKTNGRIYRLRARNAPLASPPNLGAMSARELVGQLRHANKWRRQTALRLLGDRRDASVVPDLLAMLRGEPGQSALEALWALHQLGALSEAVTLEALEHPNPHVRRWAVRLAGDERRLASGVAERVVALAASEPDAEVRSQLASTCRRLPVRQALPLWRELITRGEDAGDPHVPLLLWWALEAKVTDDPEAVLSLFGERELWDLPLARQFILERLMRRFAATGKSADLLYASRLFRLAPGDDHARALLNGFEAAYAGRAMVHLPEELAEALAKHARYSIVLGLRQRRPEAVQSALAMLASDRTETAKKLQLLQVLAEVRVPEAVPVLLAIVAKGTDDGLRAAALAACRLHADDAIADAVLGVLPSLNDALRPLAHTLLLGRREWAVRFLGAVAEGRLDAQGLRPEDVRPVLRFKDSRLDALANKLFGNLQPPTTAEHDREIRRIAAVVRGGSGVPKRGKHLFAQHCGKCHRLFGEGGDVGPDLTAYQRDDLDAMLLNVVNPSAEIREGYATYVVLTKTGRGLQGFLVEQDGHRLVLRGTDGQDVSIPRDDLEELEVAKASLMPEGLLKELSDSDLRDLIAYLRCTQPVIDQ